MTSNAQTDLTKDWSRYDFRESMFAPGFVILQALSHSGKTACGTGDTREDALERCLSETAEIVAVEAYKAHSGPAIFGGIAAHPDADTARQTALFEAQERAAVMAWWSADLPAHPLSEHWMEQSGLHAWLDKMRQKATLRRQTQLWHLPGWGPAQVVICRSVNETGQDPILGFGASDTPQKAARKALSETLEMELNLIEIMAVRSGYLDIDVRWIEQKIALYAAKCPVLLDKPAETHRDPTRGNHAPAQYHELTVPGQRPVWACTLRDTDRHNPSAPTPFMSQEN